MSCTSETFYSAFNEIASKYFLPMISFHSLMTGGMKQKCTISCHLHVILFVSCQLIIGREYWRERKIPFVNSHSDKCICFTNITDLSFTPSALEWNSSMTTDKNVFYILCYKYLILMFIEIQSVSW